MTPWAPVTILLALAVMPGEDDLLIPGSKTLREKLSIDMMMQLRVTSAASGGGESITEHAPSELSVMPPEIIDVRRVAPTMEAMQLVDIEVEAAGETNGFEDVLLDREPEVMMHFSDREIQQHEYVLENAILRAARAGMPPDELAELWRLVLSPYKEAFRWGLTGEPPAQVELGSVQWRSVTAYAYPNADYSLPSKSAIKDKKLELVELVGG